MATGRKSGCRRLTVEGLLLVCGVLESLGGSGGHGPVVFGVGAGMWEWLNLLVVSLLKGLGFYEKTAKLLVLGLDNAGTCCHKIWKNKLVLGLVV